MPLDQPQSPIEQRTEELRMSFGEHLEELRNSLFLALIGIGVSAGITFTFGLKLVGWLAAPLLQAQDALGYAPQTITTDPTAGFTSVYLKVSLIAAIILASPWIVWQIWKFIASGLYDHERRAVYILAPFSVVMTTLGILFTYYILLPACLVFFITFATYYPEVQPGKPGFMIRLMLPETAKPLPAPDGPDALPVIFPSLANDPAEPQEGMAWINRSERRLKMVIGGKTQAMAFSSSRMMNPLPDVGRYVTFAAMTGLGIVAAFQLPVVMLVLGWTQLVDPAFISGYRKYALFACTAAGAILTPTDLFSMFLLAVPLYTLFEFGLLLMKLTNKPPKEL